MENQGRDDEEDYKTGDIYTTDESFNKKIEKENLANYEVRIRKEWNRTFLELHVISQEIITEYVYQMLKNNKSPNILDFFMENMNGQTYISYDITDLQPLEDLLRGDDLEESFLKRLIGTLIKSLEYLEEYLIPSEYLFLQANAIYLDKNLEKISFLVLPFPSGKIKDKFQRLMEYLLTRADHKDKRGIKLTYDIYRESSKEHLSFKVIKELVYTPFVEEKAEQKIRVENFLEEEDENIVNKEIPPFGVKEEREKKGNIFLFLSVSGIVCLAVGFLLHYSFLSYYLSAENLAISFACLWGMMAVFAFLKEKRRKSGKVRNIHGLKRDTIEEKDKRENKQSREKRSEEDPVETQIYDAWESILEREGDSKETVFLAREIKEKGSYLLLLDSDKEKNLPFLFTLQENSVLVGKTKDITGFYLDKEVISRLHAQIKKVEGEWWLQDMGSKNGTYLNEVRLNLKEERKLVDGDKITFADISYEFHA